MPTLTQLSSNLTEIVIYAAIALVTLTGVCKCIYPLLRNASLLNRAVIKLEKSTAAGEGIKKESVFGSFWSLHTLSFLFA